MAEPAIDLAPELGPEVEVTARAAPRVGLIAILAVTLGIILSAEAVVRGLFGTISGAVGWIPFLGSVIEEPIHKIEQKIISMLAGLEQDIDKALAHNIHVFASLLDKLWHDLELMAATIVLLGALSTAAVFHYLIHPLERFVHASIRKVEEEIHRIERQTIKEGAKVTHVVVHNVFPRIKGAEVSVRRFFETAIRPVEETAKQAEKIAVRTEKRLKKLERNLGKTGFLVGLVAAVGQLAVDALQCTEFGNLFKNRGRCNLWKDLGSLLGLFDLLLFASACEILDFLSPFVSEVAAPIVTALTDVGAGLCQGGIGAPPTLPEHTLYLPANPGVTLDLP